MARSSADNDWLYVLGFALVALNAVVATLTWRALNGLDWTTGL